MKIKTKIKNIAASVQRNISNISGWRTNRRIVVIESDDWGSIRTPSKAVMDQFQRKGMKIADTQYNRLDALESNDDFTSLFEVLQKYRDKNNRPACLTANMLLANPAFVKIKESNFQQYHYETLHDTLRHYPQHDHVEELYRQGLRTGIYKPQFHGREHVQVNRWLKALRKADENMLYAFDCETTYSGKGDYNFMESFDWDAPEEVVQHAEIIKDGLQLFRQAFGYSSASFIAPCYTWDSGIETVLAKEGVKYMQGGRKQYVPRGGFNNYSLRTHTLGERQNGLMHLTRNCFFEPSLVYKSDWVDYTLACVRDAFRWNKPAIICAHRINFIGFIDESNRTRNLRMLDELLTRILRKWPEVEFVSSDELGELLAK